MQPFLDFMAGPAFKSQPQWAGCYCQFYLEDPEKVDWKSRTPEQNRAKACERIDAGTMQGYLAFEGERTVGWMAANDSQNYPSVPSQPEHTASILCFVVDEEFQGQGVATALLEFALADLPKQGFTAVQAAPKASSEFKTSSYRGPLSMFLKHGFSQGPMIDEQHCIVQRQLSE